MIARKMDLKLLLLCTACSAALVPAVSLARPFPGARVPISLATAPVGDDGLQDKPWTNRAATLGSELPPHQRRRANVRPLAAPTACAADFDTARLVRHFDDVLRDLPLDARIRRLVSEYKSRRCFPRNNARAVQLPRFVDDREHLCAVAHLLDATGAPIGPAEVNSRFEYSFVDEIWHASPPLRSWAALYNLSMDDLSRIQPSYPPRLEQCEMPRPLWSVLPPEPPESMFYIGALVPFEATKADPHDDPNARLYDVQLKTLTPEEDNDLRCSTPHAMDKSYRYGWRLEYRSPNKNGGWLQYVQLTPRELFELRKRTDLVLYTGWYTGELRGPGVIGGTSSNPCPGKATPRLYSLMFGAAAHLADLRPERLASELRQWTWKPTRADCIWRTYVLDFFNRHASLTWVALNRTVADFVADAHMKPPGSARVDDCD